MFKNHTLHSAAAQQHTRTSLFEPAWQMRRAAFQASLAACKPSLGYNQLVLRPAIAAIRDAAQATGRRTRAGVHAYTLQSSSMSTESNAFVGAARSTAASGSTVYEGERAVHEYLQFHFGRPEEVLPYECGPKEALAFTKRCADLCTNAMGSSEASRKQPLRAMDVGCAVGGVTFELTRGFDEVVGVDFSASFVEAAENMRVKERTEYQCLDQGSVVLRREAVLPEGVIPSRARFARGDACSLDVEALGSFDAVVASNLLCRLPKPRSFLDDLPALVKPGGVAVLISPYSWLPEYTDPSEWLGGFREQESGNMQGQGKVVDSFDTIRSVMEADGRFQLEERLPMPFLIREHGRKFQWGCSDGTVWRRLP